MLSLNAAISRSTGVSTVENLALLRERPILCPACGSSDYIKDGHTANGTERYFCKECGHTFLLVSKSIFNSMKIDFDILARYVQLMSFNLLSCMKTATPGREDCPDRRSVSLWQ